MFHYPVNELKSLGLIHLLSCGDILFLQISWSPDSSQLLSASGDKTAKIWDVGANSIVNTFNMGSNVLDQQLGCLWQKDYLLTISLSGYINYLDKNNPNKPLRVIKVG